MPGRHDSASPSGRGPYDQTMYQVGRAYRYLGRTLGSAYHRIEVQPPVPDVPEPVLFVSHHGWGAAVDPNLFAIWGVLHQLKPSKPVISIAHGMAWKIGGGGFMEGIGCVPASPQAAGDALADGHSVMVLPGGDLEAFKAFPQRDKILFHGRSGFARLAMSSNVPIVPIVVAGAGETLLALSDGAGIARRLGLDRRLRLKAFPISVSLPWGLNVGSVGLTVPYIPLPAKLTARVLAPMTPQDGKTSEEYASRVQAAMQQALTDMTKDRRFLIG